MENKKILETLVNPRWLKLRNWLFILNVLFGVGVNYRGPIYLFMTVLVPLLQSSPRNFPLFSLTAAATLLVRSSLLSVIMSLGNMVIAL